MVVEGLVVSAAIGLITGGAGAVAGGSAVVAKVAAQSPRFAAILSALRSAAAASSAYLRTARAALRASRLRIAKFVDARLAMRKESRIDLVRRRSVPGDVAGSKRTSAREATPSRSTSARRLTNSAKRFRTEPWVKRSSSFPTQEVAEREIVAAVGSGAEGHRRLAGRPEGRSAPGGAHQPLNGNLRRPVRKCQPRPRVARSPSAGCRDAQWLSHLYGVPAMMNTPDQRTSMRTPALKRLMSAYFHQDFHDAYGGVWEAIDAFISDLPEEAARAPEEIDWVLKHFDSEDAVDDYLDGLGCDYFARPEDGGYRGWLEAIARRVDSAIAH